MKLRTWLAKNEHNVSWLARESGLSVSFVSRLVTGEKLPSLETCARIARITKGEVTALDFAAKARGPFEQGRSAAL